MKTTWICLGALIAFAFLATAPQKAQACNAPTCDCPGKAHDQAQGKAPKVFDKAPAVGTKAVCPVTGEEFTVTKDTARSEYKGKHYVFCCPGCKPKFDADPAKYAN